MLNPICLRKITITVHCMKQTTEAELRNAMIIFLVPSVIFLNNNGEQLKIQPWQPAHMQSY